MQNALIPFHGSTLRTAFDGETVYVAIRPICEHLGIAPNNQLEKLRLDDDFQLVSYHIGSNDGKIREMVCLPQDQVLGWLYTINSNKVKPESRVILSAYRQETTKNSKPL